MRPLLCGAALFLATGCRDTAPMASTTGAAAGARATISDAPRGGNPHFFWLPPMVARPDSFAGTFDAGVRPTVRICELEGGECVRIVAEFGPGTGTDAVRLSAADEHYVVNWHTRQYTLDPDRTYRILVSARDPKGDPAKTAVVELGSADVDPVRSSRELVTVEPGRYVGVVLGTTLPIKFRIEQGAFDTRLQQVFALDPEQPTAHGHPGDEVIVTRPAGDGTVVQYLVERDTAGMPVRTTGVAQVDLAGNRVLQLIQINELGLPGRIDTEDGTVVEFTYTGGRGLNVAYSTPEGETYNASVEMDAAIEDLAGVRAAMLSRASRSEGAARMSLQAVQQGPTLPYNAMLQVPVAAKHDGHSAPITGASVYGTFSVRSTTGQFANYGVFTASQRGEDPAGTYTSFIGINWAGNVNDLAMRGCKAWEAALEPRCNEWKALGYVTGAALIERICRQVAAGAGLGAPVVYAKCIAALGAAMAFVCEGYDICDGITRTIARVLPQGGSVEFRPRATITGYRGAASRSFQAPLPDAARVPVDLPLVVRLTTSPQSPFKDDYEVIAKILPRVPDLPITLAVSGQDTWTRTRTIAAREGEARMEVPSPEDLFADDEIHALAGGQNHVLVVRRP